MSFFVLLEIKVTIPQTDLKFTLWPRIALNFYFSLSDAVITG